MSGRDTIVAGEDKYKLFAQLSDIGRHKGKERPLFEFRITLSHEAGYIHRLSVLVNGITAEDGSGESWLVTGYVPDIGSFKSCYDTRTRKGWIEITRY